MLPHMALVNSTNPTSLQLTPSILSFKLQVIIMSIIKEPEMAWVCSVTSTYALVQNMHYNLESPLFICEKPWPLFYNRIFKLEA